MGTPTGIPRSGKDRAFDLLHWAEARLAERQRRLTPSRQRLLLALSAADRPLTLLTLLEQVTSAGRTPDRVSLFRALKALEEVGLIHRLMTGGYILCRLTEDRGCHHHVVCRVCGRAEELECAGMPAVQKAAAASGFRLEGHHVEFVGLCADCQVRG